MPSSLGALAVSAPLPEPTALVWMIRSAGLADTKVGGDDVLPTLVAGLDALFRHRPEEALPAGRRRSGYRYRRAPAIGACGAATGSRRRRCSSRPGPAIRPSASTCVCDPAP